jgi:DNA-binding LytR/AlgR family response regulator
VTALLSLKSLEEKLPADQFIRCHKSFIVNKSKVTALDGGNLILGEKSIPIGQSYRDKVIEAIF